MKSIKSVTKEDVLQKLLLKMLIYSIVVLLLALQNISGFRIRKSDVGDDCRESYQFMGYGARREFLKAHNEKRALLARGEVKIGDTPLPAAANMRFMAYDCGLQEEANKLATRCEKPLEPPHFNETRANFFTIKYHGGYGGVKVAKPAVAQWWNQSSQWRSPPEITEADNSAIPFFLIAQAEADKVGCSVSICREYSYYAVACVYGKDVKVGTELYQQGIPACSKCTGDYKCDEELCKERKK
uniref:SCP extracellular domain containing protein n=1 Tax=Haemonchus contortus TaxID=6289 RepID=U6P793_HAECO|nr:SCP extracellular domain containing protein [Haemonchus contortus]CDJ88117.1 SCP extracellular domain containing protein [Haemonchus contortus]